MIDSRPVRFRFLVLSLVSLAGGANFGCKTAGGLPPIEGLRSADDARADLLATVTVAPIDRIVGDVDALSRTLGLPFAGKDLLTMLSAQHKLNPDATAQIDTAQPIGLAFVAPKGKDQPPLEAVVLSTRAGGVDKLLAALGTAGEKQKGATKITRADGSVLWVASKGSTIFASSSPDGLVAAAALALEAQRPPANDLVVSLFPDAFARWRGTDVRTALAGLRKDMIDGQIEAAQKRGGPVPGRAERLMYETVVDMLLGPLAETASGALTMDLDPSKGIRLGMGLQPRSGSAFAKQVAPPTPYVVDPALLAAGEGAPVAAIWALGPSPYWLDFYDKVFAAQTTAGLKGAAEVSRRFQAIRPHLTGAASGTMRQGKGGLSNDVVMPVKSAAAGTAVLDAVAALARSPGFTEFLGEIYGKATPQVRTTLDRGTLRSELAFPVRERPGDVGTALKAFFGSATVTTLMTVAGGRLVAATEPAAQGRLAVLMSAAPAKAAPLAPEVAGALADTKGQDGLFYLDLWSLMKPAISVAAPPEQAAAINMVTGMPGFAGLRLPVVMSYRGGKTLDADFRIPLSTLTNAANVVRPFIGAGGPPTP